MSARQAARRSGLREPVGGTAVAVASALSWSVEGLLSRLALTGLAPLWVLASRFILATGLLLAIGAQRRGPRPTPGEVRLAVASGVLGYGAASYLLLIAFQRIPTGLALLLFYLYPVLATGLAALLRIEPITTSHLAALAASLLGLAVILGVTLPAGDVLGLLAASAAAVVNAGQVLATDRLMRRLDPARMSFLYLSSIALVSLPAALLWDGPAPWRAAPPAAGDLPAIFAAAPWLPVLAGVAGLAIFPSVLALWLLAVAIARIGPSRAALVSTTEPVFAVLWGYLLLGERLTLAQILGGILIFTGVAGQAWLGRESKPGPGPEDGAGAR